MVALLWLGYAAFASKKLLLNNFEPFLNGVLVYGGTRRMQEGNIEIIPFSEALKILPSLLI